MNAVSRKSNVSDLLSMLIVAGYASTAHCSLPPETRQQLVVELEQCLIDSERMEVYLRILQAVLQRQPRHDQTLSDERLKAVFRSGLSVLNDEELVRLALNPIALCQLFDWLTGGGEEMEYWEDLMCQAVLATHGLTLADVQAELENPVS